MAPTPIGKDRLLSLYRTMLLIRRCEEQLAKAHQRGLIHGACHTYVGQEASAAGVRAHLRTEGVAVAFFGDGAVNNGAFHEGLNLAGIWKLPVLFVCENNEYATEVPFRYAAGNPTVAGRAATYGLPGVDLDGNDVLAIHAAAEQAVRVARQGGG